MKPELLYWGLLDASILTTNRTPSFIQLDHLFDGLLPIAVEELQTTYLKIDSHQYLACGIERIILEKILDEHSDVITLMPESLPQAISKQTSLSTFDIQSINLLINNYEPRPVHTQRQRVTVNAVVAILLSGIFLILGLERRRAQYQTASGLSSQAQITIYEAILGQSDAAVNPNVQPPAVRFTGELRKRRQTRLLPLPQTTFGFASGQASQLADQTLGRLFTHWPNTRRDLHLQIETIAITETALTIVGLLPTLDDAQWFTSQIQAFAPTHWQARQPNIVTNPRNDSVRFTQHFVRNTDQRTAILDREGRKGAATP